MQWDHDLCVWLKMGRPETETTMQFRQEKVVQEKEAKLQITNATIYIHCTYIFTVQ